MCTTVNNLKGGEIILQITSVFWYSVVICIIIVLWGSIAPDQLDDVTAGATNFIYDHFGWLYMFIIMAMIIFCFFLMFSRIVNIKLGKDDDESDCSYAAWFAMLVSAGMGIGLVFITTAENISHAFISSPNADPGSMQAITEAFH